MASRPPAAVPGKAFDYPIAVKSKKGGVKYKLDAGPDGMAISPTGRVTWDVPADFAVEVSVIVTVSDATGQEVFHTFKLTPGGVQVVATPAAAPPPDQPRRAPRRFEAAKPDRPARPAADGIVRPPAAVVPIKPTEAADGAVVPLPASADAVCVGGGGRFVILRLPATRQLAVFDATAGKVAKYLPLAEDGALFAAGMTKLFVLNPTANVIQRWSLLTFEKETTVASPVGGTPKRLLMGHASDGPLYVAGARGDDPSTTPSSTPRRSRRSSSRPRAAAGRGWPEQLVRARGARLGRRAGVRLAAGSGTPS